MPEIVITQIPPGLRDFEIVERKGLGHPDTIGRLVLEASFPDGKA